jgi:outer membrane protein assembly factor BamB
MAREMNRLAISVGIPAVLAVCGLAAAAAWTYWPAERQFALRDEWSPQKVELWRPQYDRPGTAPATAEAATGPPGVLTQSGGTPAEGIAGSWPRFLGPNYTAVSDESVPLADRWPAGGPTVLWECRLGAGHAGPAVHNGRVYVLDYDQQRQGDVLRCLSLADGTEIWNRWYPVPLADDHGVSRSVPAVTDDHVVTFGPACHVMCLDARTGAYRWGMDLVERYGTKRPEWYASQCPLIDGDRAIFATGGRALLIAAALAPADEQGAPEIVWETPNPAAGDAALHITHSSIVPVDFAGRRIYVYNTTRGVVGVGSDGKLLWRYPRWRPGINAPSPVHLGAGRVLITADIGARVLRMGEGPRGSVSVEEELRLRAMVLSSYQQTPVLYRGHLYVVLSQKAGPAKAQLACVDLAGNQVWTSGRQERFGWGPLLIADGKLFVLSDDGVLTLAEASPSRYRRLARAKLLDNGDAWAPMAMAGGRLLLRDKNRMLCLDVRSGSP